MNRLIVVVLLVAACLAQGPATATPPDTLALSTTVAWPHPLDRRAPRTVTVTYAVPESGRYAIYIESAHQNVPQLVESLGDVPSGATGTLTWTATDAESGMPVERGRYLIHLMRDEEPGGRDFSPGYSDYWSKAASTEVDVRNSTERLAIYDKFDGHRVRVDKFVLSNGPTKVVAEFVMATRTQRPTSFYAGFDVRGVPGGYYAQATRQPNGQFKTRVLYTRSLPGDAAATIVRCREAVLRRTGRLVELVVPRRCMAKVQPTSQIRAFFGANDQHAGYDQPDGLVDNYWTYWTRATKRGA